MDPDVCLQELRELVELAVLADSRGRRLSNEDDVLGCITERFDALDGWLTSGGFVPAAWRPTASAMPKKG